MRHLPADNTQTSYQSTCCWISRLGPVFSGFRPASWDTPLSPTFLPHASRLAQAEKQELAALEVRAQRRPLRKRCLSATAASHAVAQGDIRTAQNPCCELAFSSCMLENFVEGTAVGLRAHGVTPSPMSYKAVQP